MTSPGTLQPPPLKPAPLWRCYTYLRPYWPLSVGTYLTMVLILGLNLLIPQVIRVSIDRGIEGGETHLLAWAAIVLLALALLRGGLAFLQGQWSEKASQNVAFDLRNEIQRKLTQLSFSFHDQTETGELLSRAIQDVERIRFLTGRATLRILDGFLLMLGTAATLLWMNPPLAALIIASMPLLAWRALSFGRRFRPLSLEIQQQLAVLTTRLEQNLRGSQVVKAFAQEQAEIERFQEVNETWFERSAYSSRLQAVNTQLLFLIANLGSVAILWFGGLLVARDQLSIGVLVAFIAYLAQLVEPIRRLGLIIPAVAMASSAAERVFEVLDSVVEVADAPDAQPLPDVQGWVRFEGVSFGYRARTVLEGIEFEARPGQVIALLGRTGSGKTSLVNLIPRFYDPTQGRITLDGRDLRTITLQSLRSQIGIVLQETVLFAASIRENISFGCPGCPEAELVAAAQAAQAHDFILKMPQGYDSRVGERGVTLSGGQKQRLAIARALLMDPRILILDDATASVDPQTERKIQAALAQVMLGRTTFVIAHRLSTLRKADQILVLEAGRIAAAGTHAELYDRSDLYRQIYERQVRRDEPEPSGSADEQPGRTA